MQLVIKLYTDKAPRIGIVYPSEYQAGKSLEQYFDKLSGDTFHLSIELIKGLVTLRLKSLNGSGVVTYRDLEFKADQLKRLQAFCKTDIAMEFIHIYRKADGVFIPKIRNRAPEMVKIKGYEIV